VEASLGRLPGHRLSRDDSRVSSEISSLTRMASLFFIATDTLPLAAGESEYDQR
jgi:hypothetical protein